MDTYTTVSFFESGVWRSVMLVGVLLLSLLVANMLKRKIPFLKKSLIPNSVLGGLILLVISSICYFISGNYLFNLDLFSKDGSGIRTLEILTYHCLAIGFIAMTLRPMKKASGGKRAVEILNSGISTICTYMIQAIAGIIITALATFAIVGFAPGSGILLAFGYGQGTGQALNIGKNFDLSLGESAYSSFGLAIAALGFLTASIVGVVYLNYLRRKGRLEIKSASKTEALTVFDVQNPDEPAMNESIDKLSTQCAFVAIAYMMAYGMMYLLGNVILGEGSNLTGTIYGFNFIFGVLSAVIVKAILNLFRKRQVIKHQYTNTFLLNRISGFAFDIMIVSGICAIRVHLLAEFWWVLLILAVAGAVLTFVYMKFVTRKLFPAYQHEQFLAFFGMLTGTASTGMILLREADPDLKSPVSENLVYQNFPAIILGFPLLLIAGRITAKASSITTALVMLAIIVAIFVILNLVLFRSFIFRKKKNEG